MGLYQNTHDAESIENLHQKEVTERDGIDSSASGYSDHQERGKFLVCITFFLEFVILAGVIVLEYFLRWAHRFSYFYFFGVCAGVCVSVFSSFFYE